MVKNTVISLKPVNRIHVKTPEKVGGVLYRLNRAVWTSYLEVSCSDERESILKLKEQFEAVLVRQLKTPKSGGVSFSAIKLGETLDYYEREGVCVK